MVGELSAVRRIVVEALEDMRRQNVRYAELRTTPRPLADGTSRREYIETVLRAFRDFETNQNFESISPSGDDGRVNAPRQVDEEEGRASNKSQRQSSFGSTINSSKLIPRLLLSVDRARSVAEAMEVAELAVELKATEEWRRYVVGVDFSGNPSKGSFQEFR